MVAFMLIGTATTTATTVLRPLLAACRSGVSCGLLGASDLVLITRSLAIGEIMILPAIEALDRRLDFTSSRVMSRGYIPCI